MKKLFVPLKFNEGTFSPSNAGGIYYPDSADTLKGFFDLAQAIERAKEMGLAEPRSKIVIFEACMVVEPLRVEFSEKKYNSSGELLV